MKISVIVTVLNEKDSIPDLIESLESQTRSPDEVVISDAGSSDGTREWLDEYEGPLQLQVMEVQGNRSRGRNEAIRKSTHDIIAVTDAGAFPETDWLEHLLEPFGDPEIRAVAGAFGPGEDLTWFQRLYSRMTYPRSFGPGFIPSARSVAFRRRVWEEIGGYPEDLDFAEDTLFGHRVRKEFGWEYCPEAVVVWEPRRRLREVFSQRFSYGTGDARARLRRAWFFMACLWQTFLGFLVLSIVLGSVPGLLASGYVIVLIWIGAARNVGWNPLSILAAGPLRFWIEQAWFLGYLRGLFRR